MTDLRSVLRNTTDHYRPLEVLNRFHAIYMVLLQTFLNGESWEDLTDVYRPNTLS
jgi:hypothetical protein